MKSSIWVYGKKGCWEPMEAEALREVFGLDRVVDIGTIRSTEELQEALFAEGTALFLGEFSSPPGFKVKLMRYEEVEGIIQQTNQRGEKK